MQSVSLPRTRYSISWPCSPDVPEKSNRTKQPSLPSLYGPIATLKPAAEEPGHAHWKLLLMEVQPTCTRVYSRSWGGGFMLRDYGLSQWVVLRRKRKKKKKKLIPNMQITGAGSELRVYMMAAVVCSWCSSLVSFHAAYLNEAESVQFGFWNAQQTVLSLQGQIEWDKS